MLKEKFEEIKDLIVKKQEGGSEKKRIENLVVFLMILVITILAINTIWGSGTKKQEEEEGSFENKELALESLGTSTNLEKTEYNLEDKLEAILSKIEGVRQSKCTDYLYRKQRGCDHV